LLKLTQLAAPYNKSARPSQPPKVETALLWDLLDYAVSSSPSVGGDGTTDDVELNVNTQFLLQLTHDSTPQPASTPAAVSMPTGGAETLLPNFWDDTAFELDMADFSNLPDMATVMMPRDSWVNGHL